jgi:hypothetical protein
MLPITQVDVTAGFIEAALRNASNGSVPDVAAL